MKKFLLAAAVFMLAAPSALAGEYDYKDRTITATGQAIVDYQPELALIDFTVETTGRSVTQAASENSVKAERVMKALKSMPGTDTVETSGYEVHPFYDKGNLPKGYRVANTVRVKLSKLDEIGKIIDTAINSGANGVHNLQFALSEKGKYCEPVLARAAESAAEQAATTAKALGVKLAGIKSAIPSCTKEGEIRTYVGLRMMEGAQTPVSPGGVKVRGSVTVVFYLAD